MYVYTNNFANLRVSVTLYIVQFTPQIQPTNTSAINRNLNWKLKSSEVSENFGNVAPHVAPFSVLLDHIRPSFEPRFSFWNFKMKMMELLSYDAALFKHRLNL